MRYQWSGKHIDKNLLYESIEDFFRIKGFKTRREEVTNEYSVTAVRRENAVSRVVVIRIGGADYDFFVEFKPCEDTRDAILLGPLTYLAGFGGLIAGRIKKAEFYRKLEDEFWAYVERRIAELDKSKVSSIGNF